VLRKFGLEILEDEKIILVEKIFAIIIKMIYANEELPKCNFPDFLSKKLKQNYHSL
jgi:hypothetical protein